MSKQYLHIELKAFNSKKKGIKVYFCLVSLSVNTYLMVAS